jgi:hypothetical protein
MGDALPIPRSPEETEENASRLVFPFSVLSSVTMFRFQSFCFAPLDWIIETQ